MHANKPAKIRCAIAGTGRIASTLEDDRRREKPASHAGAITHHPRAMLVGGADPQPERLQQFGRRWKLPAAALFSDAEEMLKSLNPDILHIAADTNAHIPLLQTALKAGTAVIVLEKPVAESIEQARQMLPLIEESSSRIVVNHERRFAADYCHVRRQIANQVHGPVLTVNARLYMGRTRKIRQVLWHDGTHLFDCLRFLLDSDIEARAIHGDPESGEQNVFMLGRCHQGDILVECSPGRDHLHFEIDISFARGRIRIGNGIFEEQYSRPSPWYEGYRSLVGQKRRFGKTGYFSGMMAHAVDIYTNPQLKIQSGFKDGLAALQVIQDFLDLATK